MLTHKRHYITSLQSNEVFVFGSNYAGRHGAGAALIAVRKFGARNGQGTGLMGQSYGIATKDKNLKVLPLHKIGVQIDKFVRFAAAHPELTFLVTEIGCGLAGYNPKDIAPFFNQLLTGNIILPESFWKHIA
jgi:hypothetical protein